MAPGESFATPGPTWKIEDAVYVRYGQKVAGIHFGVEDDQLDALLDYIADGVVLPPGEAALDLTVIRGTEVLGYVHRRPGLPSTYTNLLQPRMFGRVEPLPN